ncbi:MAG: HDIG domain-containing protein [Peptococcaceae bacterium]|nr:HDIG domain-containing protein [Peptococcaceae bacterium]
MGLPHLLVKIGQVFSFFVRSERARRVWAFLFFYISLALIISVRYVPAQFDLQVGDVAPRDIPAPKTVTFIDETKTEEARRLAEQKVEPQYTVDPQVSETIIKEIDRIITEVRNIQSAEVAEVEKGQQLESVLPFELPTDVIVSLASGNPDDTELVGKEVKRLVNLVLGTDGGVRQEELDAVKRDLTNQINDLGFSRPYELLARNLIQYHLRPNAFFDAEATAKLRKEARATVTPVRVTVQKNEYIIRQGEVVTAEHLSKLEAFGLLRPPVPFKILLGTVLLTALLMGVVFLYIYQQKRKQFSVSYLYLLGIIVVTVMAIGKVLIAVNVGPWPEYADLLGYSVPVAAAGMLIAILIDARLAIIVVAAMAIMLGVMTGNDFRFALVGFLGGIAGVYSVSKLSQRSDLARAGIYVFLANTAAIFTAGLLSDTSWGLLLASSTTLGLANGILSSILANGALPFLENTFGITSSVKLLELSNPGHPLLRRLLMEAPGTYHHSIIVGNLAEAAAQEVGADSVLVRVGAYYHDIGKVRRPYFFIENQMTNENPHDKIAPSLSTLILTSHVKDGVEAAREHKLPERLIDIIEQHHGTSLISFFYHKALEQDDKGTVQETDFRYDGPKPQTREAGIVMLADSVEAAVRSMSNPTPGQIEGLVRKIIKDKQADGQLDECDLNFRDLDLIAGVFVRILTGIFHNRVEYPDIKEVEGRKPKNGYHRK